MQFTVFESPNCMGLKLSIFAMQFNCFQMQVSAHRFLLAAVSPVFRREFFGPLATSQVVIDIKETTIEAFSMMVKYIYHPGVMKDITCPQLLCQMLNLAER